MTIEQSKEKLKKYGYTHFNLKDFDENEYDKLLEIKCNKDNNLQKYLNSLRADGDYRKFKSINDTFESFIEANQKKEQTILNKTINPLSQIWFFTSLHEVFSDKNFKYNTLDFEKLIKKIVDFYFDMNEEQKYSSQGNLTYYNKGCFLQNHSDGTGTGRICALLIYLNETYNEEDGGILILNNTDKVIPTFGTVAIIDLQSFDIPHMVTEVVGGIGRYAILSFVRKKEDEFK